MTFIYLKSNYFKFSECIDTSRGSVVSYITDQCILHGYSSTYVDYSFYKGWYFENDIDMLVLIDSFIFL